MCNERRRLQGEELDVVAFLLGLEGQRRAFLQHDLRAGGGGLSGTEIEPLAKLVAIEHRVLQNKRSKM